MYLFMKAIIPELIICILLCYLNFDMRIYGQSDSGDIPYKIEIEKNFKNIKEIKLSAIGNVLSYIPLETKPECMIGEIHKIEFSDSFIFISDFVRILQFSKTGKFIKQIGSAGRGPEEYAYVKDFCIDEKGKRIYIISVNRPKIWVFGFDGNFIETLNLSFRPSKIIPKDKESLMYYLNNFTGRINPSWVVTNRQGIILMSIKNRLVRTSQPGFNIVSTPLYLFENSPHFIEFGIDTLYYFKDNQKKPYAIFCLDKLKMDIDPLLTSSMVKNHKFLTDKIWIGSINENERYLFIKFFKGMTNGFICAIYDKKTGTVSFLKDNVFKNDMGGGAGFWPMQIVNDKILIAYADAFDLLKGIIPGDLRKKLTETSNPVLMVLK